DQASGGGAKPQSLEETAAHPHSMRQVYCASLSKIEPVLAPRENIRKNVLLAVHLLPQRIGERAPRFSSARTLYLQLKQVVRILDRQHPQHDGINETKDCRVCANSKSECQNNNHREAPGFAQHPQGVTDINEKIFDGRPTPHGAAVFFGQRDIPELASSCVRCLFPGHSASNQLLDLFFEVLPNL